MITATETPVKLMKHYVQRGDVKARVFYSKGSIMAKTADGSRELRECVTLYAKDYSRALGKVFPATYVNETESQSDYFDEGHVRIFPGDPLYAEALARCR